MCSSCAKDKAKGSVKSAPIRAEGLRPAAPPKAGK
jgi:hypothetical protein